MVAADGPEPLSSKLTNSVIRNTVKRKNNNTTINNTNDADDADFVCPPPKCQCSDDCTNSVNKGDTFCKYHMENGCSVKGGLSGYEPKYSPEDYNSDSAIQHSHNCFAYALGVKDYKKIKNCRKNKECKFHVPGKTKKHPEFSGQMGKTCSDVIGRTMADVPRGYMTNFITACKPNFSKIAVVVDEKNDLHYYKQSQSKESDKTVTKERVGLWDHKPGARKVTDKDAYGAKIYRPDLASRCYPRETPEDSGLNYNSFCSYMCIPRDQTIIVAGGGNGSGVKSNRSRKNRSRKNRSRKNSRSNSRMMKQRRSNKTAKKRSTNKSGGGLFSFFGKTKGPELYKQNAINTRKVSKPTINNTGKINVPKVSQAIMNKNTTPFAYQGYSSHTGQNQGYLSRSGQNTRRLGFNQRILKHINSENTVLTKNNVPDLLQNMNFNTKTEMRRKLIKLSKAANKNPNYNTEFIEQLNLMYSDPALKKFLKDPSPNHSIGMNTAS
jgi:hypothetical protein